MSKLLEIASQSTPAQSETTDDLQHAQNAQEIINALIGNEGTTPDDLRNWMPPLDLSKMMLYHEGYPVFDAESRLRDFPKTPEPNDWQAQVWYQLKRCQLKHAIDVPPEYHEVEDTQSYPLPDTDRKRKSETPRIEIRNPDQIKPRWIADHAILALFGVPSAEVGSLQEGIIAVHQLWLEVNQRHPGELLHPLEPLVQAWQQANPPKVEIEKRPNQIAPAFIKDSRITTGERLPTGFLHTQGGATTQLSLPSFEGVEDDIVVHALPIEIYQGGRGTRGAPLDERIFFNALLARPYGKPEPFNAVRLEPTLRDYVDWLYPNGWNRTLQLPLLQKALYDVHNKRISYERRDWNIVQVLAMPNETTKLDDPLPLIIRYPDGVLGNGPMIDAHRMRLYGLVSASKWRAWIRLHYLWDTAKQRNGGYPIYATIPKVKRNDKGYLLDARGNIIMTGDPYKNKKGRWAVQKGNKPQKAWYHPYAIHIGDDRNPQCDKIPVLTDNQLVALFFDDKPVDTRTFRKRLHDSIDNLMGFESDGVVIVERDAIDTKRRVKGWRIIPVFLDDRQLYNR